MNIRKLVAEMAIEHIDFDPDSGTLGACYAGWRDMRDFSNFLVSFFRTVGVSDAAITIYAAQNADGTGNPTLVKTRTGSQPNLPGSGVPITGTNNGDQCFLETTDEEIEQAGVAAGVAGLRYVSANIIFTTTTDEGVVTYVRANPRFAGQNLTADIIG